MKKRGLTNPKHWMIEVREMIFNHSHGQQVTTEIKRNKGRDY